MAKKVQYTTNQPSATTDYLAADNTWKTMSGGGGGATWGSITGTLSTQTDLQTALNAKENTITGAASTITTSNLTGSRALVSNGGGKVDVSAVTTTELGYLSGVTSDIQTQLNAKAAIGSGTSFSFGLIGNTTVGAGVTTYVSIVGSSYNALEFFRMIPTPQNCSFSRFYIYITSTQPASGSLVITLRKNQVDTALAITIAAGSVSGRYSNTATSVAFAANDWNSVKIQNNATSASAVTASLSIMITI